MAIDQDQLIDQRLEQLEHDLQVWQNRIKWRTVALLGMIALLGVQGWWHMTLTQRLLGQNDALTTVFEGHPTLNLTPKTFNPSDLGAKTSRLSRPHR